MNKIMPTLFLLITATFLYPLPCFAERTPPKSSNLIYQPGSVSKLVSVDLDLFVAPTLKTACDALRTGQIATAKHDFEMASRHDPEDLGAFVGYIQSVSAKDRELILVKWKQMGMRSLHASTQFKLGTIALYVYGDRLNTRHLGQNSPEERILGNLSQANLRMAYDKTHLALCGFLLISAYAYTPEDRGPTDFFSAMTLVYEDMLQHLAGQQAFDAYLTAKESGWLTPQPPISNMTHQDMRLLERVIWGISQQDSLRAGKTIEQIVNGKIKLKFVFGPYSDEQKAALDYLDKWRSRIKLQLG